LGLREVAHYTTALQQLLAPACHGGCLQRSPTRDRGLPDLAGLAVGAGR
jgi:hypothetical protein